MVAATHVRAMFAHAFIHPNLNREDASKRVRQNDNLQPVMPREDHWVEPWPRWFAKLPLAMSVSSTFDHEI